MNTNFNLPEKDPYYIANEPLFQRIIKELQQNNKCYINGVPGVGKSSLATEIAHKLSDTHLAIWFDCASELKIDQSVRSLATLLNINNLSNLEDNFLAIKNKLNQEKKYLFILDNVETYESVEALTTRNPENFFIVITTRDERLKDIFHGGQKKLSKNQL